MRLFCQRSISRSRFAFKYPKRYHTHGAAVIGKIDGLERQELSTAQLLRKIKPYVWPTGSDPSDKKVRLTVAKTGAAILGAKGVALATPIFWKNLINDLALPGNLDPTLISGLPRSASVGLWALSHLLEPTLDQYKSYTFATVKQRTTRVIGKGLIEKLFSLDHRFHSNRETGALLKAVDRGNRAISTVLHASCIVFAPALFQVMMTAGFITYFCGPGHALSVVATAGIYAWWSVKYTEYRTPFRISMNKADMEAGNLATDSLLNYETVKFFGNEKFEAERYDAKLGKYEQAALKTDRSLATLNLTQTAILSCCLIGNIWFTAQGVSTGAVTVGDVVMMAAYFHSIQRPLGFLGSTYRDLTQAKTDFETMWNLMEEKREMEEGSIQLSRTEPSKFGYNEQDVLKNCTFDIAPGEKVAVVGGSGSGKSTLVKLLFRFYDPKNGQVMINGNDLRDCQLKSVRDLIGVVPQDCVLFNDTIFNNIRYGRLDATPEEVYEAAKVADLDRAVVGMRDSYDTIVGERGTKLSGGEKQRLAIARCFLKNPSIFVYDEATSSLDSLTEQRILNSLEDATRDRSLLVIAHRLSTIVNCDKIIVLKNGSAVEMGNHEELLALEGEYAKMWKIQSSENTDNRKIKEPDEMEQKRQKLNFDSLLAPKSCCGGKC